MESWDIIQTCELAPDTGLYGKRKFIAAMSELTPQEFNRFCKQYLHLQHFYESNLHAFVTDEICIINQIPNKFNRKCITKKALKIFILSLYWEKVQG